MQSELMLRLLLRNKIVGYMRISPKPNRDDGLVVTSSNKMAKSPNDWYRGDVIHYDSFELGVKVGENWLFEGDILQVTLSYNDVKEYISGILRFNGERFFMENTDTDEEKWASLLGIEAFLKDGCLVGNIHEEEKP